MQKRIIGIFILAIIGVLFVVNGLLIINSKQPKEIIKVWTYIKYFNSINAGNLTLTITSIGKISALNPANISIDLHWFYPDNFTLFTISFEEAVITPSFPFSSDTPPPTSKITLINTWDMPTNHYCSLHDVTLHWITSGVYGITLEEYIPGYIPTIYTIEKLIEVEPTGSSERFANANFQKGTVWIGFGLGFIGVPSGFQLVTYQKEKRPEIDLFFLNDNGFQLKEIEVNPLFKKEVVVKRKPVSNIYKTLLSTQFIPHIPEVLLEKIPDKDLIPINVGLTNNGSKGAQDITVFLEFPDECMLFEEYDVKGSPLSTSRNPNGLDVDNKSAIGSLSTLTNDITKSPFSPIYVRFQEREAVLNINVKITQESYPPKTEKLKIIVKPKYYEVEREE